ncbi:unnamed protein product [Rhizophagus irregularis]|nr:unnamed protein product [Rhizophagus irregularis]
MALDITSGLRFVHSKEIMHRDLIKEYSLYNILFLFFVFEDNFNKYLIANLGLSKKLKEVMTSNSSCIGMGLGVLLGNSSGRPLLSNYPQDTTLAFHISDNNLREDPIEGTSPKYQQLYQ